MSLVIGIYVASVIIYSILIVLDAMWYGNKSHLLEWLAVFVPGVNTVMCLLGIPGLVFYLNNRRKR